MDGSEPYGFAPPLPELAAHATLVDGDTRDARQREAISNRITCWQWCQRSAKLCLIVSLSLLVPEGKNSMLYPVYWNHKKTGQEFVTYIEVKDVGGALMQISRLHSKGELSPRDYLHNIRLCFVDDSGEDWIDNPEMLRQLAATLGS